MSKSYSDWLKAKQARKQPKPKKKYPLKRTEIKKKPCEKKLKSKEDLKPNRKSKLRPLTKKSRQFPNLNSLTSLNTSGHTKPKPRKPIKKGNRNAKRNSDFYRKCYAEGDKYCEECGQPLQHYAAYTCSHIITRGANTFLRDEPRNQRQYCFTHHNLWEYGDRESRARDFPNTYAENMLIKEELTLKYYKEIRGIKD